MLVLHKVASADQVADALTKALPKPAFMKHKAIMLGHKSWEMNAAEAQVFGQEDVDEISRLCKNGDKRETINVLGGISTELATAVERSMELSGTQNLAVRQLRLPHVEFIRCPRPPEFELCK